MRFARGKTPSGRARTFRASRVARNAQNASVLKSATPREIGSAPNRAKTPQRRKKIASLRLGALFSPSAPLFVAVVVGGRAGAFPGGVPRACKNAQDVRARALGVRLRQRCSERSRRTPSAGREKCTGAREHVLAVERRQKRSEPRASPGAPRSRKNAQETARARSPRPASPKTPGTNASKNTLRLHGRANRAAPNQVIVEKDVSRRLSFFPSPPVCCCCCRRAALTRFQAELCDPAKTLRTRAPWAPSVAKYAQNALAAQRPPGKKTPGMHVSAFWQPTVARNAQKDARVVLRFRVWKNAQRERAFVLSIRGRQKRSKERVKQSGPSAGENQVFSRRVAWLSVFFT